MNKAIYFCCLSLVVMIFCNHPQNIEDRYGAQYNGKREKIGLMPLNSQWISYQKEQKECGVKDYDKIGWNPKNLDSLKNAANAFYGQKEIKLKSDTLISEADIFAGPKSFTEPDRSVLLYYIYVFRPYDLFSTGWMYQVVKSMNEDERGTISSANYITKNEADSILCSWGLRYH